LNWRISSEAQKKIKKKRKKRIFQISIDFVILSCFLSNQFEKNENSGFKFTGNRLFKKKIKAIQIQINKTEKCTHYFSANYKFSDSLIQIPVFLLKGYIVYSSKNCSE